MLFLRCYSSCRSAEFLAMSRFCSHSFWDIQVEGGWILEGKKRWIGNSTFADLLVVFARNTTTNQINGYDSLYL
jgi:hypothetical protein